MLTSDFSANTLILPPTPAAPPVFSTISREIGGGVCMQNRAASPSLVFDMQEKETKEKEQVIVL